MSARIRMMLAAVIGLAIAVPSFAQTKKPSIWDKPNLWEPLTPFDAPPIVDIPDGNPLSYTNNLDQSSFMVKPDESLFTRTNWPGVTGPIHVVPKPNAPYIMISRPTEVKPLTPGQLPPQSTTPPRMFSTRIPHGVLGVPDMSPPPVGPAVVDSFSTEALQMGRPLAFPDENEPGEESSSVTTTNWIALTNNSGAKHAPTNSPPASIWRRRNPALDGIDYHW